MPIRRSASAPLPTVALKLCGVLSMEQLSAGCGYFVVKYQTFRLDAEVD